MNRSSCGPIIDLYYARNPCHVSNTDGISSERNFLSKFPSSRRYAGQSQSNLRNGFLKSSMTKKSDRYQCNENEEREKDSMPLVDVISNYPSLGAEVIDNSYWSQLSSLSNSHEDQRPTTSNPYNMKTASEEKQAESNDNVRSNVDESMMKWEPTYSNGNASRLNSSQQYHDNSVNEIIENKQLRDQLAKSTFYKTETQRLYEGVDWYNRGHPTPSPPMTSLERRPDLVSMQTQRYEKRAEPWQGSTENHFGWDRVQTRQTSYFNKRPLSFTTPYRNISQVPNYGGHCAGKGEKDVEGENYNSLATVRSTTPTKTMVSKRGYIPGYTGCRQVFDSNPPLSNEAEPRIESSARAYRKWHYPVNKSTFKHQGSLSNMVSLAHPFNPQNQIDPRPGTAASGHSVKYI